MYWLCLRPARWVRSIGREHRTPTSPRKRFLPRQWLVINSSLVANSNSWLKDVEYQTVGRRLSGPTPSHRVVRDRTHFIGPRDPVQDLPSIRKVWDLERRVTVVKGPSRGPVIWWRVWMEILRIQRSRSRPIIVTIVLSHGPASAFQRTGQKCSVPDG